MNDDRDHKNRELSATDLDQVSGGAPPRFVMTMGKDGVIRCGTAPGGRPLFGKRR